VRIKVWFYRFTAAYFVVSAVTGLALYFRPLAGERAGFYSDAVKEWLVMLHNGEIFGWLAARNRYLSGVLIGSALAWSLLRFSVRSLRPAPAAPRRRR
jgi:hypothetical protein